METTLTDAPSFSESPSAMPPRVRLPGEDESVGAGTPRAPEASERLASKPAGGSRKGLLMSSVGLAFLVGSIGVVGYLQRARFEQIPVVREVLAKLPAGWTHQAGPEIPGKVAVAVRSVPLQMHALAGHHVAPQVKPGASESAAPNTGAVAGPVVATPVHSKATPDPRQTQLAQFEAFKPGTLAAAASAAPTPAASTQVAVAPPAAKVAAPEAPAPERGAAGVGSAPAGAGKTAPAPGQAEASASKPVSAPPDPVAQAVALKAAPMTGQEQLSVVHLVTELGVLVRDQRTEIANLRDQVTEASGKVNTQLMDFDRRLSIAEAKGAIDAAMGAGETTGTRVAAAPPPPPPAPAVKKAAPPPPLVRNVSDYRIQAASPGLAMLSTTLDGGSSVQVAVGAAVPGIGHVQAIFQNGTIWEVKTDHGVIR